MSKKESERKPHVTYGLQDLAKLLPGNQPISQEAAIPASMEEFIALDPLMQLQRSFVMKDSANAQTRFEQKVFQTIAVKSALEMDKKQQRKNNIRIIAIAPVEKDGSLHVADADISTYPVHVLFPFENGKKYVSTTRFRLADHDKNSDHALQAVDTTVNAHAEVRKEGPWEAYHRQMTEVKIIDSHLARQENRMKKATRKNIILFDANNPHVSATELNDLKREVLLGYVQTAEALRDGNSKLPHLFSTSDRNTKSPDHTRIDMLRFTQRNLIKTLINPSVAPEFYPNTTTESTDINVKVMKELKEQQSDHKTILVAQELFSRLKLS